MAARAVAAVRLEVTILQSQAKEQQESSVAIPQHVGNSTLDTPTGPGAPALAIEPEALCS
jgi:hypothetical protein